MTKIFNSKAKCEQKHSILFGLNLEKLISHTMQAISGFIFKVGSIQNWFCDSTLVKYNNHSFKFSIMTLLVLMILLVVAVLAEKVITIFYNFFSIFFNETGFSEKLSRQIDSKIAPKNLFSQLCMNVLNDQISWNLPFRFCEKLEISLRGFYRQPISFVLKIILTGF
jgi:hypothetical protein